MASSSLPRHPPNLLRQATPTTMTTTTPPTPTTTTKVMILIDIYILQQFPRGSLTQSLCARDRFRFGKRQRCARARNKFDADTHARARDPCACERAAVRPRQSTRVRDRFDITRNTKKVQLRRCSVCEIRGAQHHQCGNIYVQGNHRSLRSADYGRCGLV